jgi:hypothetical protein
MQELIEVIRAATTSGATTEQKAAGVQACHTIIAALATEPGKPLVPPTPAASPLARPSFDQMLDMIIAKLSLIAKERHASPPPVPAVRGLRVPATAVVSPRGKATRPPAMKRVPTRKP